MPFQVTKSYGHERGLSACFRQWKANSHCKFFHGYALAFDLTFEAIELNEQNWVIDFGGLGFVAEMLKDRFDHKMVVALDDPELPLLRELASKGLVELTELPAVGCEMFAKHVFEEVEEWLSFGAPPSMRLLRDMQQRTYRLGTLENNPKIISVTCREHAGNSATYHRGL